MVDGAALAFGVAFVVFAVLFVVAMRRVLAAPRKAAEEAPAADPDSHLVAREVLDEQGQRVGESVRVEGEDVIVKKGAEFLAVPKGQLREDGEKLHAEGVDWEQAKARGDAWRARQEDVMAYDEKGMPVPER